MSPVSVRPAGLADVAHVLRIWLEAESRPTLTDTPEHLQALVSRGDEQLLIAELDGQPVGTLIAAFDGWRGTLYRMAVAPAARRRGVGRALVREGERRLAEKGALRIQAQVIGHDTRARAFWEAVGYRHQAEMARYTKQVQS